MIDVAAANIGVIGVDGRIDIGNRQLVILELVRVHLNLVFLDAAAEGHYIRYAMDGAKRAFDHPIL